MSILVSGNVDSTGGSSLIWLVSETVFEMSVVPWNVMCPPVVSPGGITKN